MRSNEDCNNKNGKIEASIYINFSTLNMTKPKNPCGLPR